MEGKPKKEQLIDYIFYGIVENNISPKLVRKQSVEKIISHYTHNANYLDNYVYGELDTFKRATCLLLAINKVGITKDKEIDASIALDAAFKMCETPYRYTGKNADEPKKLESVDFKKSFEIESAIWNQSRETLIKALTLGKNAGTFTYFLNLELSYRRAVQLKKIRQ